jgi:hypothetical protein
VVDKPVRLIALVAVASVGLILVTVMIRRATQGSRQPSDQESGSTAPAAPANPARRPADFAAPYDHTAPEPVSEPPRLSPTALWLAAPATPLLVSVTADATRTSQERITFGGGTVSVSTGDRTRITLTVPPEALPRGHDVTLTVITSVSGLPFARGVLAAVRITPDGTPLRRPAVLSIEAREVVPREQILSGFAIRGGRELHLARADRLDGPQVRGRVQIALPLARLGTYGVARASAQEIDAAASREPSSYMGRLEQRIALAFPRLMAPTARSARWSVFPTAHAQGSPASTPAWLSELFRAIEESFEQVVVAQFKHIPQDDCKGEPTWAAVSTFHEWGALPALLFPVERQGLPFFDYFKASQDRIDRLHERGYTDGQIEEIDAAMDSFRKQALMELTRRGYPLVEEAYRRLFARMFQCCKSDQPMQYHLDNMLGAMQDAQYLNFAPLDPDAMTKIRDCSCRVTSKSEGAPEIFVGTITHVEEEYVAEREEKIGGTRTIKQGVQLSYRQELVLQWPTGPGSTMSSRYTVVARQSTHNETKDHRSCGVVGREDDASGNGREEGLTEVAVAPQPNQPGKYRILYPLEPAHGYETWKSHWSAVGCQIFNPVWDKSGPSRPVTISGYPRGPFWIDAQVDPARPFELSGSTDLEEKDDVFSKPHRPKVEWKLRRCGTEPN